MVLDVHLSLRQRQKNLFLKGVILIFNLFCIKSIVLDVGSKNFRNRLWHSSISNIHIGISIHFFWSLHHLRHIFSDEKTKQMKIARQSIAKEEDRLVD